MILLYYYKWNQPFKFIKYAFTVKFGPLCTLSNIRKELSTSLRYSDNSTE